MAWSSTALTAESLSRFAADKPIIGVNSLIAGYTANSGVWSKGTSGTISSTQEEDADGPVEYIFDGATHLQTYPDETNTTGWTLAIRTSPIEFDFIAIMNTNLATHSFGNMTVQISDEPTFAVNDAESGVPATTISSVGEADGRKVDFTLFHTGSAARRYSDVEYIRFTWASPSPAQIPKIGEIILGRRYQLKRQPDRPFDNHALSGDIVRSTSASGVITSTERSFGAFSLNGNWPIEDTSDQADIIAFHKATRGGARPFVWCQNPSTAPNSFHYMYLDDPSLAFPQTGPYVRPLSLAATEQGPHYLAEE